MNNRFLAILLMFPVLDSFAQLEKLAVNQETAVNLSVLPFEYPSKFNQVLTDSTHLESPSELQKKRV